MKHIQKNINIVKYLGLKESFVHKTDKYGYDQCEYGFKIPGLINPNKHKRDNDSEAWHKEDLKYHVSWDWLMSVIHKLWEDSTSPGSIYENTEEIWEESLTILIKRHMLYGDIEKCHQAVSDLIDWSLEETYKENLADSQISIMKDQGLI